MSRYDDPDSPEYREHNLGDDRMTADERAIERLEGKVARLTRELALEQAHLRAERATSESLAKELSAAHAKATRLEEAVRPIAERGEISFVILQRLRDALREPGGRE